MITFETGRLGEKCEPCKKAFHRSFILYVNKYIWLHIGYQSGSIQATDLELREEINSDL